MVIHVQQGGGDKFRGGETLVEFAGLIQLVDQFLWDHLAGLVVAGVHFQHFRLVDPVLHDLGGEFHEIAGNVGPCQALVGALRQQSMQSVPEFMEKGFHLVIAQQGRLVAHRLGEVAGDGDHRPHVDPFGRGVLLAVVGHPGASLLRCPRKIIHVEYPDEGAVAVFHLIHLAFGVKEGHVLHFGEGESIKLVGHAKNPVADIVQLEIGTQLLFIKVELLLPHLLGIIPPVPTLQFEVASFAVDHRLDVGGFLFGSGDGRGPHLGKQVIHIFRCFGHVVVDHEGCPVGITHQVGLL